MRTVVFRSDSFYHSSPPFAFLPGGKCITVRSGGYRERTVVLSQLNDGEKFGSIISDHYVVSITPSYDGQWIVLGEQPYPKSNTQNVLATVWDATTFKMKVKINQDEQDWVGHLVERAVDVSPDSTGFAMSSKTGRSLGVWSFATGERLLGPLLFGHASYIKHVRFSPRGDRLAAAVSSTTANSPGDFHIYNSQTGDLLTRIHPLNISSFAWCNDNQRVFMVIGDKLQCLDVSVSPPRYIDSELAIRSAHIALSRNSRFLVSLGADNSITFWDTSTLTRMGPALDYSADEKISSIILSADDTYLAGIVSGRKRTVIIWSLREVLPPSYFMEIPFVRVSETVFAPWVQGDLLTADKTLSNEIEHDSNPNHDVLANRALVRTRLHKWREAQDDADRALDIRQSVAAHIAKALALVGQGKYQTAMQHFDLVFHDDNLAEHDLLRLIKCIITFVSGRYDTAISHINELVCSSSVNDKGLHYLVRVKMCDLYGSDYLDKGDHQDALQLFRQAEQLYRDAKLSTMYHTMPAAQLISLIFGWQSEYLVITIEQHRCEALLGIGHVEEAAKSLLDLLNSFNGEIETNRKVSDWVSEFKDRCARSCERFGDEAVHAKKVTKAVELYTSGLSLEPPTAPSLLIKRSQARSAIGSLDSALEDADKAVLLDPLSPWGYDRKHTVLYSLHRYEEAVEALNEMLSRLKDASDSQSCELRQSGINPFQIQAVISTVITDNLRSSPLVLIDTDSGRLCDKLLRTRAFQACPGYKTLVLSPPSQHDREIVKQTVAAYFRYATLSHTWDATGEPLFHDVLLTSVHDLPASPANTKLQLFCSTSRDAGFKWSWSDTCCIDKTDGPVLQESLTSMYQWYHASSLTLVHLRGVLSQIDVDSDDDPLLQALVHCIWNTRAWTLQEYFASTVIRFYTEDWKPYLRNTRAPNDKDIPAVTHQMAQVTGVDAHILTTMRPGPDNVREKLRLASKRIATRQEDMAYSLFGIFGVSMPAIYGEGHKALGRLLETVLYRSGDVTILAWTGQASDHNSCLPAEIIVYAQDPSAYIPSPITHGRLEVATAAFQSQLASAHQKTAERLYDRVVRLPSPRLVNSRLSLSCIAFPISSPKEFTHGDASQTSHRARTYMATAAMLGQVAIRSADALDGLENLVLVHPWLDALLDPMFASPSRPADGDIVAPPQQTSHLTKALRLLARLRQPFGTLLLRPLNYREFRRVATDHLIRVQVRDDVSTEELLAHVRVEVLDIL